MGQQRFEFLALGDIAHVGHEAPDGGPAPLIGDDRLDVAVAAALLEHPELLEVRRLQRGEDVGAELVPHVLTVAMMCMVIPLFGASFSLFTSGLAAVHFKRHQKRADEAVSAAHQIVSDLYKEQTGRDHPQAAG